MPQMVNFVPQFKLVVCSNTFMEICSQDHGTRRRIRVVDFESLFTENPVENDPDKPYQYKLDKKIKDKFETWKGVFAAMLVEHAYSTNGNVNDCARVMASSNSYLDRQDYLAEFINETMEPMETGCIPKPHLTSRFKEWYQQNFSGKPPNMRDVVDLMNKQYGKLTCGVWRGIRFKPQTSIHSSGYGDDGSIHTHSVQEENEYVDLQEI
jgi:phage/plasmid-associated DNA primase